MMAAVDTSRYVAAVKERLSPTSAEHSMRVAEFARVLAERFDVDGDLAWLGGLLHDWDRDRALDEILSDASKHRDPHPVEREMPYLLHARTGAHGLEAAFPDLPEAVLRSVALHTIGDTRMSPLDQVVWLADALEPGRSTEWVRDVRARIDGLHLEGLFALAYGEAMCAVVRSGRTLHPVTAEVWNSVCSEYPREGTRQ